MQSTIMKQLTTKINALENYLGVKIVLRSEVPEFFEVVKIGGKKVKK